MPIYEYQCQACAHDIEVIQKMTDPPLEECPSCGELALRKKVSAAAFRLKGGGWYETDFKTGGKKNLAGEGASSDAKGGEKTSGDAKTSTGSDGGASKSSSESSSASTSGTSTTAN